MAEAIPPGKNAVSSPRLAAPRAAVKAYETTGRIPPPDAVVTTLPEGKALLPDRAPGPRRAGGQAYWRDNLLGVPALIGAEVPPGKNAVSQPFGHDASRRRLARPQGWLQRTATPDALGVPPSPSLPIDAREQPQAIEWYLRIGSGVHVGTRDFVGPAWWASEDWIASFDWIARDIYRAAILDESPDIARALDDVGDGFLQVGRVALRILGNLRGYEGQAATLWRHDRLASVTIRELDGVVDRTSVEAGPVTTVEITTQDLSALDALIPRRLTSTELFGSTCPDPGMAIQKVIGRAENVPLPFVVDDTVNSIFRYVVGEGAVSVTTVRRNRIGQTQLEDLHPTEWSASTTLYPGLTVVTTPVRQVAAGGGFHQLYADVAGPDDERNPAIAFGRIINDPVWGGGLAVDVEQIVAKAATIPAVLRLDGVIGANGRQVTLRDVLVKILKACGGRAQFDADRGWQVYPDAVAPTSARMTLRDDAGPGEKTLLRLGRRVTPALNQRTRTLTMRYAPDYVNDGEYLYSTAERAVDTVGLAFVLGDDGPGEFIRDRAAADWVSGYLAARLLFATDTVEGAAVTEEGRRIQVGDIVHVICPQLGIAGDDRRVIAVTKGSGEQGLTHERWDTSLYAPSSGALPVLRAVDQTVATVPPAQFVTQDLQSGSISNNYFMGANGPFSLGTGTATVTTFDIDVAGGTVFVFASFNIVGGGTATLLSAGLSGLPHDGDGTLIFLWNHAVAYQDRRFIVLSAANVPTGSYTLSLDAASSGSGWTIEDVFLNIVEIKR